MNLDENNEKGNNNEEEITVKIRTMDKEFEVKIKKSLSIKALKEKIEQVIKIFINY
jgi:hypothetical protein